MHPRIPPTRRWWPALLAAPAFWAGCSGLGQVLESPSARLDTFRVEQVTPRQVRFQARLWVTNPNPVALCPERLVFRLQSSERTILLTCQDPLPVVPAFARQTLDCTLRYRVQSGQPSLGGLHVQSEGELVWAKPWPGRSLAFTGIGLRIPEPPRILSFAIRTLPDGSSWAVFCLENPNDFPLTLAPGKHPFSFENRLYTLEAPEDKPIFQSGKSSETSMPIRLGPANDTSLPPPPEWIFVDPAGARLPVALTH